MSREAWPNRRSGASRSRAFLWSALGRIRTPNGRSASTFGATVMLNRGVSEVTATIACESTRGRTRYPVSRPTSP